MKILLAAWLLIAAIGPWLVGDPLAVRGAGGIEPLLSPSAAHWLGTDDVGRDVLARLVAGARVSVGLAALAAFLATTSAVLLASLCAGRRVGRAALLAACDVLAALPALVLIVAAQGLIGRGGWMWLAVLIALPRAADTARLALVEIEGALVAPHSEAAAALGASRARLVLRHALPLAVPALAAATATTAATAVLSEAALGFLGLGFPAPTPSWGELLLQAHRHELRWWLALPAGLACASLAFAAQRVADSFVKTDR